MKGKIWLIILFFLAFLIRFIFSLTLSPFLFPDEVTYMKMLESVREGKGLSYPHLTASMLPGYPLFLLLVTSLPFPDLGEIRFFQALLGGVLTLLVFLLGKEIFSLRVGISSSLITAFYPTLVFFSGLVLSESLYTLLTLLFIFSIYRFSQNFSYRWAILTGLWGSLSSLVRATTLSLSPLLYLVLFIYSLKERKRILPILLSLFIFSVIYSPWVIRNWLQFHHFILTTTDGGWVLYSGNNPMNKTGGGIEGVDVIFPEEARNLSEIERDTYFKKKAWEFIKSHPGRFFSLSIKKFVRVWRLYPSPTSGMDSLKYRLIMLFTYAPLIPFSLIGYFSSFKYFRKTFSLILLVSVFTLLHMIFIGSIRYRVPLLPVFIILAAYGGEKIFSLGEHKRISLKNLIFLA